MTRSIIFKNRVFRNILAVIFWLAVWQTASLIIGQELFLASPIVVIKTFLQLITEVSFWETLFFSFSRIVFGFLLAILLGILFAVLSFRFESVKILLYPITSLIKSTPVVSFVILALLWIGSRNLSIIISFLMVFPVIYNNTLQGIMEVNKQLIEMADVFKIPLVSKIIFIYVHEVMPYFVAGCTVSLGLCWKSGVAAEVIGIPSGSIGERLYQAKIYLNSGELFAWTLVIILISMIFEKFFLYCLSSIVKGIEKCS
ncbi:MAG: ABC transporter permease [Flexilinea sp.]